MKTSKNILTALLLTGSAAVPALSQTVSHPSHTSRPTRPGAS